MVLEMEKNMVFVEMINMIFYQIPSLRDFFRNRNSSVFSRMNLVAK